ncbi:ATPase, T2SS/T4P/T4SS family [Thermodesulfobacteriota bacterium]
MKIKNIENKLKNFRKRLGEILIDDGLLVEKDLQDALAAQKIQNEKLGNILISMGLVNDKQIAGALSKQLDIPLIRLGNTPISKSVLSLVPAEIAEKYVLIPIQKKNKNLIVAMSNPLDYDAVQDLRVLTGSPVYIVVAPMGDVLASLKKYYPTSDISEDLSINGNLETEMEVVQQTSEEDLQVGDLQNLAGLPPVIRFTNSVLADAIRLKASDIHAEPQKTNAQKKVLVVRCRIDGIMQETLRADINIHASFVSRIKIISGLDISERRIPQDGKAQVKFGSQTFDLRISTIPTTYGEKVTIRILNPATASMIPEDLGFSAEDLENVLEAIDRPQGIILITGPTGSGKSSSLYAFLNKLNKPEVNIITVEDPVEFDVPGINQVQINTKAGITFAKGLRAILRQDPDIVMLGEIRDPETAGIAVQAAQTGHLVLSTLHTNDAPSAVTRLMDLGIDDFQITSALVAVLGQRLVRRIHDDCKVEDTPDQRILDRIAPHLPADEKPVFYKGAGCQGCNNTGYAGRMGLYELLMATPSLRMLIKPNVSSTALKEHAVKEGFKSLTRDGILKALQGLTSLSEVFRVAPPDVSLGSDSVDDVATQTTARKHNLSGATAGADTAHKEPLAFTRETRTGLPEADLKILVAEDNEIIQEIICDALESRNYQTITADNGREAFKKIMAEKPDLVVTDYIMPEMDGLQLIQLLRSREDTKKMPILMLTSADEVDSEISVMKAGADDYLTKPIDRRRFLARVDSLARRTRK